MSSDKQNVKMLSERSWKRWKVTSLIIFVVVLLRVCKLPNFFSPRKSFVLLPVECEVNWRFCWGKTNSTNYLSACHRFVFTLSSRGDMRCYWWARWETPRSRKAFHFTRPSSISWPASSETVTNSPGNLSQLWCLTICQNNNNHSKNNNNNSKNNEATATTTIKSPKEDGLTSAWQDNTKSLVSYAITDDYHWNAQENDVWVQSVHYTQARHHCNDSISVMTASVSAQCNEIVANCV